MGPMKSTVLDLRMGDLLVLKKSHPCGSSQWVVVRLGADIGLRCLGCDRRFLMSRPQLSRRLKSISRGTDVSQ